MTVQLTQKERMLLEDQKSHEEVCIKQYKEYANQAKDPQLKQLFNNYASKEQEHLNTINQILNGQVPQMSSSQSQQGGQSSQSMTMGQSNNQSGSQSQNYNQEDAVLCQHMLMTEKYVAGTYNTAVFEFKDPSIRQVLNHIEKEEQEHGEGIFNYMYQHGMYTPQ
ncbi:MAG: spore coat protein [Epulopiscium sp.]|nr:spore coat protein [Candidatus Epulonipiscium sp.]